MRKILKPVTLLALLLPLFLFAEEEQKPTIAVMDLQSKGMNEATVLALSDRLRAEIFATNKFEVLERAQMDDVLKEQGFQASGACTDEACQIEMGQILGVERLVTGSLGKLGTKFILNLRMINIETGKIQRTVFEDCKCPIEDLTEALHSIAKKLAGIAPNVIGRAPASKKAEPAHEKHKVKSESGGGGGGLWITLGIIALAGGGAAYWFLLKAEDDDNTGSDLGQVRIPIRAFK